MENTEDRITVREAAQLLEVDITSIYNHVKAKTIGSWKIGNKVFVSRSDCVDYLKTNRKHTQAIVNWRTILRLEADVERLKLQVMLLNKINDLNRDPIALNDQELGLLYESCIDMLMVSAFKLEDIEVWSDIFMRLEDTAMKVIKDKLGDINPAIRFRKLAKRMANSVEKLPGHGNNLSLQILSVQLRKGLTNLSTLVAIGAVDEAVVDHARRLKGMMGGREAEITSLAQMLRPSSR
jgi:excisionase family DNA binding protein